MLSTGGLALAALIWLGLLFGVAVWGDRQRLGPRAAAVVYSLSLAVYCTSWTFYGTVAQGAKHGWWLPPTFLGTILLYLLALPFLERLLDRAKSVNATSVADFIASRFGQSTGLAALITGLIVIGMLPYVALQLKAVAMSYSALVAAGSDPPAWQDSALYVAILMAAFAMLFGTRRASSTESNHGLVLAVAFEALFKLAAMLAVGAFVLWQLYDGPLQLHAQSIDLLRGQQDPRWGTYATLAFLGVLAMFTLPHQFHVGVIECGDRRQLRTAAWLFPLFLLLISLPIWPLAAAGSLQLQAIGLPADLYVMGLPLASDAQGLTVLVFLGGVAAAAGMVILASLSISIMVSNHWAAPLLVRRGWPLHRWWGDVRSIRRLGIAGVLGLSYVYSRVLADHDSLAEIGAQSFSALAQLGPAVVLAVYRPRISAKAIGAGVIAGFLVWAYVLILPLLMVDGGAVLRQSLGWLSPSDLAGLGSWDALPRAVLLSLATNLLVLGLVARGWPHAATVQPVGTLDRGLLQPIAVRFLGETRASQVLGSAGEGAARFEERLTQAFTSVLGASSTRLLLDTARRGSNRQLEQVATLVGDAAQAARFSQQVLGAALENMSQGISVVDADLRLVAWNRRYVELFQFPPELLQIGRPIEDLIRHALSVLQNEYDDALSVRRRLQHLRDGTPHHGERRFPDGSIVEIRGEPMSAGGFVTTYTDVTAFRRTEAELKVAAESLERRVEERTAALNLARNEAEQANQAKSRLLAAITHDMAQPLNAAKLFAYSQARKLDSAAPVLDELRLDNGNLIAALGSAEDLLGSLLDISRLGAGAMQPKWSAVAVSELIDRLAAEFGLLSAEKGLDFRARGLDGYVWADPQMLRRVLQNFLSNALRYTERGGLLLAARRRGEYVRFEVWDTGPGIAEAQRSLVFQEFRRLSQGGRGLGLGLAIAQRMAKLLGARLELKSRPGRGSVFALEVATCAAPAKIAPSAVSAQAVQGRRVLVLDNDAEVLAGMRSLLGAWGCTVEAVRRSEEFIDRLANRQAEAMPFEVLILDYHLDAGARGLDLLDRLPEHASSLPRVLITADHDPAIRAEAEARGCFILHKPVKPLALRSLMARL
ncbi:hybrid sensor histidine kinase/response regulator [Pseudomarimonas arenosa]|uniref:histidine kinase n=1 Tax=Pseudomarimonas arenosa TaxID=2774145 RepID=A0AAW3ZKA4_9GAMM|nr:PAS-domain containing protein [Pseudomarimonas arenosa]MBD8526515.1 PAS-domain containing protein [Pseudomarimonas arenosa]